MRQGGSDEPTGVNLPASRVVKHLDDVLAADPDATPGNRRERSNLAGGSALR
jgi:hypothetical protein